MADYFMFKFSRKGKRIFSVTIFGVTASCVTIYGIMQCLQTIYCRFGEFYVETCDNILMIKLVCVYNKIEYMKPNGQRNYMNVLINVDAAIKYDAYNIKILYHRLVL